MPDEVILTCPECGYEHSSIAFFEPNTYINLIGLSESSIIGCSKCNYKGSPKTFLKENANDNM